MAFSKEKGHERAERFAAKGQHDKAAREYQAIVEHDPKDIRAWLMLADCLVRCGDKPGAVERYERVAQYYVEAKEHNKALAVYRQVLALDAQRLDVQIKMAALNLQVGHTQDGIAIYERVAHAQLQLGRVADALNTYRLVADADPTVVARRLRLAELYSRENRTAEAVEAFRAAGRQLRTLGRLTDYVRVAERLLYHDENDLPTIRDAARAYLELGDPRRALMKLNGLLRAHPKDEEGIELLADTFMALGKPEKALSALEELARALRAKGPAAKAAAIRVLRRGLEWRPAHAEFREALTELEGRRRPPTPAPVEPESAPPPSDDDDDIDAVDEGDMVELDEDDVEMDDAELVEVVEAEPEPTSMALPEAASVAPGTRRTVELEALPSTEPSLTQSVLSEVEVDAELAGGEGLGDLDKILFEARTYIKYRLFEHALEHVHTALLQQPQHVGALTVQAKALAELGQVDEAAAAHLAVAELVAARDPKLAREQLAAARTLAPRHPRLEAVARMVGTSGPARVAATPSATPSARPVARPAVEDDGDSGAFDVVGSDFDEAGVDLSPPGIALDLADEPRANLAPAVDEGHSTQPFTPIDLAAAAGADEPARTGRTLVQDFEPAQTGRTLVQGFEPAQTGRTLVQDFEPARTGRTLVQMPAVDEGGVTSDGLDFDGELDLDMEPPQSDAAVEASPGPEVSMTEVDVVVELDEPAPVPAPAAQRKPNVAMPQPVAAPAGDWVDLSDELEEIQFYVDQGLDDDAEAALDDLEAVHPGHPQIAKFRGREPAAAPQPARAPTAAPVAVEPEPEPYDDLTSSMLDLDLEPIEPEAAADEPLVSFDDQPAEADEPLVRFDDGDDEDDYLSAIFADPVKPKPKPRTDESSPGANLAAGQAVDAATAFDLGVAYREMGLVDASIAQFETAARDEQWRARALTLLGALRVHRGETDRAIADLKEAVRLASTPAEASEAAYELGVLYGVIGDSEAAIQHLLTVAPGYRDRDERLAELGF